MLDPLTGGVSYRVSGKTLFTRFHEFLGPDIEDARLDPLPPAEVTDGHLPAEAFQDDTDLIFWGVLPAGLGPDLPDEGLGLLGLGLCCLGLTGVVLGHFWLLSWWGRSIPCTRSPNTPPLSCFSPLKCVPLSLNAYTFVVCRVTALRSLSTIRILGRFGLLTVPPRPATTIVSQC